MRYVLLGLACLSCAEAALAQGVRASDSYASLVKCRSISDPGERLACFDKSVAALTTAVEGKQVAVVDREEVRAAKRSLFGIALPEIRLFDNDSSEPIQQIESSVRLVGSAGPGRYSFGLADGGTWRMLEGSGRAPEKGEKVVIRRAALGSYLAKIGGGRAVRVERVR